MTMTSTEFEKGPSQCNSNIAVGVICIAVILASAGIMGAFGWFVVWPALTFIGHQINWVLNMVDTSDTAGIVATMFIIFVGIILPTLLMTRRKKKPDYWTTA